MSWFGYLTPDSPLDMGDYLLSFDMQVDTLIDWDAEITEDDIRIFRELIAEYGDDLSDD